MMTPEQEAVLRSVRKLVDFWQITPEELAFDSPERPPAAPVVKQPLVAKYRHPLTGQIWYGDGPQPAWLREALTREGYTVDELRVPSAVNS